jgi:hypothetical protein
MSVWLSIFYLYRSSYTLQRALATNATKTPKNQILFGASARADNCRHARARIDRRAVITFYHPDYTVGVGF